LRGRQEGKSKWAEKERGENVEVAMVRMQCSASEELKMTITQLQLPAFRKSAIALCLLGSCLGARFCNLRERY
jgi:hypothetical protein